ncbi:MAG: hypothetical protein EHM23_26815 [Acidobacteria bacterium]|nr:MAG: hypothetical protein EHM23_26815 [Acidobacteriota bacterium]
MSIRPSVRTRGYLLAVVVLLAVIPAATMTASAQEEPGAASFWTVVQAVESDSQNHLWLTGITQGFVIRVLLDQQTTILDPHGEAMAPEAVPAGSVLFLKAEWTDHGLLAKFLSVSDAQRMTVTGVVEQVSAGSVRVAGIEFVLEPAASVEYVPSPGDLVTVFGRVTENGVLVAAVIKQLNQIELFGNIQKIELKGNTEAVLQVCTKAVRVTGQTLISRGYDKARLAIGQLSVGQWVKIAGQIVNGDIVATAIVIIDPKSVSVAGVVTAFDSTSVSVKAADQTVVVRLNSETKVEGTLAIGATVYIEASLEADGSLLGLVIKVKGSGDNGQSGAFVRGAITNRGTDHIVVSGVTVKADPNLPVMSPISSRQFKFSDLKVGDTVEVSGTKQPDGSILAQKIALLPPPPPVSVRGIIKSLGAGFFFLGETKVIVTNETIIRLKDKSLTFADLKVGDQVTAYGNKAADGSFEADVVEVMPPSTDPPYASVRGKIASVGTDSFVVGGVTVKVNEKTAIWAGEKQIQLKDLKAGDLVEVGGINQADGSLLAIKITVLPPNATNISTVEGLIESLGTDHLVVKGLKILVNDKTAIREGDRTLKLSDLKVGLKVAVGFSKQGDVLTALKILVMTAGGEG